MQCIGRTCRRMQCIGRTCRSVCCSRSVRAVTAAAAVPALLRRSAGSGRSRTRRRLPTYHGCSSSACMRDGAPTSAARSCSCRGVSAVSDDRASGAATLRVPASHPQGPAVQLMSILGKWLRSRAGCETCDCRCYSHCAASAGDRRAMADGGVLALRQRCAIQGAAGCLHRKHTMSCAAGAVTAACGCQHDLCEGCLRHLQRREGAY